VAEDRALAQEELRAPLIVDRHTDEVAREQIARELHAVHLGTHGAGQGAGERGLSHARNILDQDVTTREERDRGELDDARLAFERAFNDAPQLCQTRNPLGLHGDGR